MDTLIPARKRAASVALLFCGRDGKTDLSRVGNVGGAGVGNRELGLDKIGGVDRRSCDLKDTKPAAKIKSTASALREVFRKPEWILGIGACKTHISLNLGERRCRFLRRRYQKTFKPDQPGRNAICHLMHCNAFPYALLNRAAATLQSDKSRVSLAVQNLIDPLSD
jgi:hypothetical protein